MLQDFTADRDRLLSILTTLEVGENQEWATEASNASASNQGAAFGQDDSEFNIFNTDRQLSALQTASNTLGYLNEKKVLIYFASGLHLNGIDNQAQLHASRSASTIPPMQSSNTARDTTPKENSPSSPPPTRSASSKTR